MRIGDTELYAGGRVSVERRGHDYMAYVTGEKGMWDQGKTVNEAIGALIINWGSALGIVGVEEGFNHLTDSDIEEWAQAIVRSQTEALVLAKKRVGNLVHLAVCNQCYRRINRRGRELRADPMVSKRAYFKLERALAKMAAERPWDIEEHSRLLCEAIDAQLAHPAWNNEYQKRKRKSGRGKT